MLHRLAVELRYTDTFFPRFLLALGTMLYGIFAFNALGAIFLFVGLLAGWRLFDKHPRLWVGRFVNLFVATLWLTITAQNIWHRAPLADNVGEFALCLTSLFVITRTDLTAIDRGTA